MPVPQSAVDAERLVDHDPADLAASRSFALIGFAAALTLMSLAMVVPAVMDWDVRIGFPPIYAHWMPRVGPGTTMAVALAVLGVIYGERLATRLSWPVFLVSVWMTSLAWLTSLALVDGRAGLSSHVDIDQFLHVSRHTSSISTLLHTFESRIPLGPGGWPTHVAGHPPGALLFFALLGSAGLGTSLAAGVVVTLLASTMPVAVLTTMRTLAAEDAGRLAAPFLVLAPAAIWEAVSGDAVYATCAAWGLTALAAATRSHLLPWSILAGLLFGSCLMFSYGLPLLGILALTVLVTARTYRPLLPTLLAALAVVGAFWVAGFSLWSAYPAIHQRYWAGVASHRPASYWLWGDLAALCFSAGPILGAAVGCWLVAVLRSAGAARERLSGPRPVILLGGGALVSVVAANVSLMSKAEVERIWLPFVPWLLLMCALLPARHRRWALAVQVGSALVLQHLFLTAW